MVPRWFTLSLLTLLAATCSRAAADDPQAAKPNPLAQTPAGKFPVNNTPSEAGVAFFEAKIRPILVEHCYRCHSQESGRSRGGLRVDSHPALQAGGERGPAIVPGSADKSWLIKAVQHADPELKMPPDKKLPASAIADLRRWIEMGAPDPRKDDAPQKAYVKATADFWSFQPIGNPKIPADKNGWARRPLDHFILAGLQSNKLVPATDAAPDVLLRRLHFDLVGLPPTPAATARFQAALKKQGLDRALAAETDALLASPQFAEKWARHWLDVARFGESSGGEANISFPYAWRYRDYVIDAIAADMPFDRFLTEQIAGDLLPYDDEPERARLLIATGFLAVGPKNLDEANRLQFRADLIDEQIDALTRGVLANSIACARCHDHKFDPYSMEDYYALAGIFGSTKTYFGTAVSPSNRVAGDPLVLPRIKGQKIFHPSIPAGRVEDLKKKLAELKKEQRDRMAAVWKAVAEGRDTEGIFSIRDALRIFWTTGSIEGQLEKVDEQGKALPLTMGVLEGKVADAWLLQRGEVGKPSKKVTRRFPEVFDFPLDVSITRKQSGRLELARWLTNPRHPLTTRVYVNRVWKHLFGEGIVRSVDNFGSTGERPSNPELLDHLATRFVQQGWSLKKLVRDIVLSRTYRQASTFDQKNFLKDPDNRLLWRMPKRRLEAEAIRDAMLAAAGELKLDRPDASLVGRVIFDRPIALIGLDKRIPKDLDGSVHRSVYLPVIRDRLPDALELFDFAEPSLVTGHRETTNVPLQALYLMNSPFVQKRSTALARRLQQEAKTDADRVDLAYQLCFARSPDPAEKQRCLAYLADAESQSTSLDREATLASFCQALFCTAEFRNMD